MWKNPRSVGLKACGRAQFENLAKQPSISVLIRFPHSSVRITKKLGSPRSYQASGVCVLGPSEHIFENNMDDIFDSALDLEETHYQEGFDEGHT
jgi:hypothetical protein